MTDQHQPRRGGLAALLAIPLLCCAGHALLLALGATSLGALLAARAPLIVLVGLVLLLLGLTALAAIRSPRTRTRTRTRSEQSYPPPPTS